MTPFKNYTNFLFKNSKIVLSLNKRNSIVINSVKCASTKAVELSYNAYDKTNVSDSDKGLPLIIMHGLFGSKQNWRSLCKAIVERTNPVRKVYAVDARNHGESPHVPEHSYESMAEDVVLFMEQQGIEKAAILGHSMGGRTMMYLALRYPTLIERTIIVDVSPKPFNLSSASIKSLRDNFRIMKDVKLPIGLTIQEARQNVDSQLKTTISDKSLRDFLLTNLMQTGDGSFKWRANVDALGKNFERNIAGFPSDVDNCKYNGPVLFIGGAKSDYLRPDEFPEWQSKYFPNAKLVMVPNCGHWVHAEQPNKFLDLTVTFLNES